MCDGEGATVAVTERGEGHFDGGGDGILMERDDCRCDSTRTDGSAHDDLHCFPSRKDPFKRETMNLWFQNVQMHCRENNVEQAGLRNVLMRPMCL